MIIQSSLWFIGSIVWINEYFCCVGVYITALLCASADEMVREGRKWAHSLGYSPFFFFFAKLQSFSFGARQPLLCCQAAECFAESWAAWQGYVEAKLISLKLQPKAATIIKLRLDHVFVIHKAHNTEMEANTGGQTNPSLLYPSSSSLSPRFDFPLSFFFFICLTTPLLSTASLLLFCCLFGSSNRCRFSASRPGWPLRASACSSNTCTKSVSGAHSSPDRLNRLGHVLGPDGAAPLLWLAGVSNTRAHTYRK